MADSQSGFPSRETGTDPIVRKRGSNQILLGGMSSSHFVPKTSQSNRVQAGQLPRTMGPMIGRPTAAQPAGSHDKSLED